MAAFRQAQLTPLPWLNELPLRCWPLREGMGVSMNSGLRIIMAGLLLVAGAAPMQAAGALAIGTCAAYGYAYDYPTAETAQAAAIEKCSGECKQVVTTKKGCVAFAIDGRKPCGPHGFANAPKLGQAQNTALKACYKHGGKDCVIRAWICDVRG
jgi:hypothetical protein